MAEVWSPGKYEVNLYVPEITTEKRDYFRFFKVARFEVNSSAKQDLRYLLPSRGIESDSAEIQNRSGQLVNGASTPREKAKAIYDYVAKNMTYDMEKYRKNEFHWSDSAIKSLRTKKGMPGLRVFDDCALEIRRFAGPFCGRKSGGTTPCLGGSPGGWAMAGHGSDMGFRVHNERGNVPKKI